ncbi:glycosyl hydrolase family 18 protein [Sutcliffiella deserti]|uniref:glycosyl hydrolase family 18 protein n=1 Tax=Sutcliffiella deserti TaxID=2875501 RepID=UPI001CBDF63C|nr:glycosyl hydrolase family 18 protein [Sutcliffiella deserti]
MQRREKHNNKKIYSFVLFIIIFISILAINLTGNNKEDISTGKSSKTVKEYASVDLPPEISNLSITPFSEDRQTVYGEVVLSVEAKDDNKIAKVEFYSNNGDYLISTVTSEPYTVNWATDPWVPDGEQQIKVIAYDDSNQTEELSQRVMIDNLSNKAQHKYKMVGYYAGWATYSGYEVADIDASKLTHLNYAFANISETGKIAIGDDWADLNKPFPGDKETQSHKGNFNRLNKLKERHPHLKTLISVGGWTWSARFSDVALTEESRTIFAESVLQFMLEYGFDGVDLDWEYPVSGGLARNKNRLEDKRNYTLLLKKIRETLDSQSDKDGKEYLLTIATGASKSHAANMELALLHPYVDYIQLMTYDIHGEWDPMTGLNAPLYQDSKSSYEWEWSVQDGVQTYLDSGVPAEKLVMGLPFYGRVFDEVNNAGNGMYQPFANGKSIGYANIDANYINQKGFKRIWIEDSKVPVLYNGSTLITYDDVESIGYKTEYIQSMELGGAMMWELSQDPDEVLLRKVYRELKEWKKNR